MRYLKLSFQDRKFTFLIGVAAILTVVSILMYPAQTLDASALGLRIWWNMVFPALLPFFILCDIVIAYGIAHALGVIIDPFMRRLFRLPGIAGWSVVSSLLAGSPAGVEATVVLRQAGRIDQNAAERITMMSHYANPIFMITIVAAAFLQRPDLALFICMIHYMSALASSLLFRSYHLPSIRSESIEIPSAPRRSMWSSVIIAIRDARQADQRSFGHILGDAVSGSLQKLMMIGGTIMMFAVLLELISVTGVSSLLTQLPQYLFPSDWLLIDRIDLFFAGISEIHVGVYSVTQLGQLPIMWKTAVTCAVIGWGGLAVHMQVRALLHATDIRYTPFLIARIVQSILSMLLVIVCWSPYHRWFGSSIPSYQSEESPPPLGDTTVFWDIYLPWRDSYLVFFLLTFLLAAVIYSSRHGSR